jgi:putative transposase
MNREEPIADNLFYHVYNRGNDRERIFGGEADYRAFLGKMKSLACKYSIEIPVYVLMPNHYHLIAKQECIVEGHLPLMKDRGEGDLQPRLSKMMGALATSTAKRYNLKYEHIGHLFQGPFRYKQVPEDALWDVACYIHLNPVRAGLVKAPEEWAYSNFAELLGKRSPSVQVEGFLQQRKTKEEGNLLLWQGYTDYVREVLHDEHADNEFWKRLQAHVEGYLHPR